LLELADVGSELQVPRINSFHDGVGLLAGFDAGSGVLMQDWREAEIDDRTRGLVERFDDAGLVRGEIVGLTTNAVGSEHDHRAAVLLDELSRRHRSLDGGLALSRVGQVQAAVTGDERKLVALEQRTESPVGLHAVDLPAEQFEALKPEARHVPNDLFNGVWVGKSGCAGPRGVAPRPGNTGVPNSD